MNLLQGTKPTLHSTDRLPRSPSIPEERIQLLTGDHERLQKRQSDGTSAPQTPAGSDSTPVVIGVVIPVLIVAIILFVVWKRRQRIVEKHKGHDKYRSLDYGVDESALLEKKGRKKQKKSPEMTTSEGHIPGRQRGISMDLGPANPYLLPPEVASSRESIHSLSRSLNTGDDKYRATTFVPDDGSMRSPSSLRNPRDDTSSWTGSSHLRYGIDSRTDLLSRSQHFSLPGSPNLSKAPSIIERPPKALHPPSGFDQPHHSPLSTNSVINGEQKSMSSKRNSTGVELESNHAVAELATGHEENSTNDIQSPALNQPQELPAVYTRDEQPKRQSLYSVAEHAPPQVVELEDTDYSFLAHYQDEPPVTQDPAFPEVRTNTYEMDVPQHLHAQAHEMSAHTRESSQNRQRVSPRMQPPGQRSRDDSQNRQRGRSNQNRGPHSRERSQPGQRYPSQRPDHHHNSSQSTQGKRVPPRQDYHNRQSSRPRSDMPPPGSNRPPQTRMPARRGDSKSRQTSRTISEVPEVGQTQVPTIRHEDEDEYDYSAGLEDYAAFIGYTYRQSMIRPLPPDDPTENPEQRANRIRSFYKEYFDESSSGSKPSQGRQTGYYDGSEGYDMSQHYRRGSDAYYNGRNRAMSHGSYAVDGPRAYSSMSGRMGPRMGPKKKLPPPKPLMLLPTPHKLKDADFLPNAIDFAPPRAFRNQRSGTLDSMKGGLRPYAPGVKAHVPLTSSYDDLAMMPSPHSLRKSGTFTGLDFAPPRRFRDRGDTMSETGSIRSNRSNLSQMQIASIRNGAYRVSKIPKEVAGTRDDMFTALKPKWDMRGA